MLRTKTVVLTLFVVALWSGVTYGEEAKKDPVLISVTSESTSSVAPDCAEIHVGVSLKKATPSDALRSLMTDMERTVAALKKSNIDEKDIRTDAISLRENVIYKGNESVPDGYAAAQSLRVTIRDRSAVASTLQVAVDNGANRFYGLVWHVDAAKQEEWREKALPDAIAKAKERAKVLARLLGKELGDLRAFSERASAPQQQREYARAANSADAVPVGEQELKVTVTLTYELK
ncbi:SIMPL domain-containing protein [Candidatus Peregrinibacteria bacterium]|nr:SIMPL domain-containing protein [Candidatus Peregrinibacteria bacterium]